MTRVTRGILRVHTYYTDSEDEDIRTISLMVGLYNKYRYV